MDACMHGRVGGVGGWVGGWVGLYTHGAIDGGRGGPERGAPCEAAVAPDARVDLRELVRPHRRGPRPLHHLRPASTAYSRMRAKQRHRAHGQTDTHSGSTDLPVKAGKPLHWHVHMRACMHRRVHVHMQAGIRVQTQAYSCSYASIYTRAAVHTCIVHLPTLVRKADQPHRRAHMIVW